MVWPPDVLRAAKGLILHFGDDATTVAKIQADGYAWKGDMKRACYWRLVEAAVEELLRDARMPGNEAQ